MLLLISAGAAAEDYATVAGGKMTLKEAQGGLNYDGWDAFLGGRYDIPKTPLFLIGDFGTWKLNTSVFGFNVDYDIWRYDLGGGYAWHPSDATEIYARIDYYHMDISASVSGFGSNNGAIDAGHAAVGLNSWLNDTFKAYVEAGYVKESHHVAGYQMVPGIEAKITPDFRLYADYSYTRQTDHSFTPTDTYKFNIINVGIKIPFGGAPASKASSPAPSEPEKAVATPPSKQPAPEAVPPPAEPAAQPMPSPAAPAPAPAAAPAPAPAAAPAPAPAAAPAPAPAAAPAPVLAVAPAAPRVAAAGVTTKVRSGAKLRGRPTAYADGAALAADAAVTLKTSLKNGDGVWWYVAAAGGTGWMLEGDLDLDRP